MRHGAVWALAGGFVLGMVKLTCQAFFGTGKIENPALLAAIGDFNFLYATGILFLCSLRADDRRISRDAAAAGREGARSHVSFDPRTARR